MALEGDAVPGLPGQHIDLIVDETFNGEGKTQAFLATTAGASLLDTLFRVDKGVVDVLAVEGDTLPGGVGTYIFFPNEDSAFGSTANPAAGRGVFAFLASVDHPTASEGIFAVSKAGAFTIALDGDPAPSGDFFFTFGAPVVRRKSIVFYAETGTDTCIYAVKQPGRPITTVACLGDTVPAPVGGVLDFFSASATGSSAETFFASEVAGAGVDECLFKSKRGVLTTLQCTDDAFVNGEYISAMIGALPNSGPTAESKNKGLLYTVQTDVFNDDTLVAVRKNVIFPLFRNFVTVAPNTGGLIAYNGFAPPTMSKKTVAFVADLDGGTASSAVFLGLVK
jgi:hypothetical protein